MILNPLLYAQAKEIADSKYKKTSAYKSGFIVKTYKGLGGRYANDGKERGLARWFQEDWSDVGHSLYPVMRPTVHVNAHTPKLVSEISPTHLATQIKLKQKIKGNHNLPPF